MATHHTLGKYLQEIRRLPLLTAEEEISLSRAVHAWKEQILPSQTIESQGRHARERLIAANLGLVVHIAKKYLKRGLELDDLIQEGVLGLDHAVDKYDPTHGYRFSTYAYWWIRQAITRALNNKSRIIRIPAHQWDILSRINATRRVFMQQHGRSPSTAELSKITNIPSSRLEQLIAQYSKTCCVSLDQRIGEQRDTELMELIASDAPDIFEAIAQQQMREFLNDLVASLPERDATVLRMRFGLGDEPPQTLQSIGDILGVSRERVRQIEARALQQLREYVEIKALQDVA